MTFTVRGGFVLDPQSSSATPRDIVVDDNGRIASISPPRPAGHDPLSTASHDGAPEDIDATGMVVAPGFVDTHRHTWQTAMRGSAFGWDLGRYMNDFQMSMAPAFTAGDVYAGTLLGALAAIDSGITTLRDESHVQNSWSHTQAAVSALRDSGIRACFGYGWPSSTSYMKGSTLDHPAEMERARAELLPEDDALVTMYAHLRGPGMSSPEIYGRDLARVRALGLRASIHAGSAPREPGRDGDVGWMCREGLLGEDITLVHCGRCTTDEYRMMAENGTHASVTAALEAVMPGLGAPAYPAMRAAGLRPSLGIDVEVASSGSMFDVMRAVLATHQIRVTLDPVFAERYEVPTAGDLLDAATSCGAKACGLDGRVGTIEVGKEADLILVDVSAVNTITDRRLLEALVNHAHPGNVDTVLVQGRVRKRHGQLVDVNGPRLVSLLEESWRRHSPTSVA